MDPLALVILASFGLGYVTGSGATHAIATGAKAIGHGTAAIVRKVEHPRKKAAK